MLDFEPKKPSPKKDDNLWWRPALLLFFQLSGWIAFPIIIAIFLGRWLDERYGTEPWLYLSSVGISFVVSVIGIVKEGSKAIKDMEQESNNKKEDKKDNKTE